MNHLSRCLTLSTALLGLAACGKKEASAPAASNPEKPAARAPAEAPAKPGKPNQRLGDPGLTRVEDAQARHFPQQTNWVSAGVRGGIPTESVRVQVPPGGDLAAAVAGNTPGVVELAAGVHEISAALQLPSGVVLRGAEAGTVLRFRSSVAVEARDARNVGVERLVLEYAGEEALPDNNQVWANLPGFVPGPDAAIQFSGVTDSWISDVTVSNALSHPLALRGCEHVTVRDTRLHGTRNRGSGAGALVIEDCHRLLVSGLSLRGLRYVALTGPAEHNVFKGWVSGAGIYFRNADVVRGNLFEDLHFLFQPGYLFRPFAKDALPLGPENLLFGATTYQHGTDALGGNVLSPDTAYMLQPYMIRSNSDRHTARNETGFVAPYKHVRVLPGRRAEVPAIPPSFETLPKGLHLSALRNGAALDDWTVMRLPDGAVTNLPIAALVQTPLDMELEGPALEVRHIRSSSAERLGSRASSEQLNRTMGQFGWAAVQPGGGEVDLLKLGEGSFEHSYVLQRAVQVPGEPLLMMSTKCVGCTVRVFIGPREVAEDEVFRLQPGLHLITVLAQSERKMSLVTTSTFELRFALQDEPEAVTRVLDVSAPDLGSLYPFAITVDPLARERAGLNAWRAFFTSVLRVVPLPDLERKVQDFRDGHADAHVAWVADGILQVLRQAPHRESDTLSPEQWGKLLDYYAQSGLWERKWAGGKAAPGAGSFREFYPEILKETP